MIQSSTPHPGRSASPCPGEEPAPTQDAPTHHHAVIVKMPDGSLWWVDTHTGELLADATAKFKRQLHRSELSEALGEGLTPGYVMTVEGDTVFIAGKALDFAPGDGLQERFRLLHHLTARPENQYLALAKRGKSQVCLAGAAFHAPSRWDSHTMAHKSFQNRKRAKVAMKNLRASLPPTTQREITRMLQGRKCRRNALGFSLLTLTVPKGTEYISLEDKICHINQAFSLLRRRSIWKPIRGAVKGVEAVIHSWIDQADPYHVHIHLLILAPYLDREKLAEEWADCLGVPIAFIDLRRVRYNPEGPWECSVEQALEEVTKYVTKGSDLAKMEEDGTVKALPEGQLLELERIERWPRQFELLGALRGQDKKELPPVDPEGDHTRVHTTSLSVGEESGDEPLDPSSTPSGGEEEAPKESPSPPKAARPPSLRALMMTLPFQDWCRVALARANRCRAYLLSTLEQTKGWRVMSLDVLAKVTQ